MPTRATIVEGAQVRAAITSALTHASGPMGGAAIFASPIVVKRKLTRRNFDNYLNRMRATGQIERAGRNPKKGNGWLYKLPGQKFSEQAAATNGALTVVEPQFPRKYNKRATDAPPTVRVDYDRKNGRMRLEVQGNLILDFGAI